MSESTRTLLYSVTVTCLVTLALIYAAKPGVTNAGPAQGRRNNLVTEPTAIFPANAATLGAIPDSDIGSPVCQNNSTTFRDVTFTVAGAGGLVSGVSVSFNASHTFLQDLEVSLRGPGGSPTHLLFSATGTTSTVANTCAGSANDLSTANTYTFTDIAAANWWTTAATNPVPSSNNRTVVTGIGGTTNPPATTSLTATFAAVNPNGTWTLRFRDRGAGDTGTVTAASLSFVTEQPLDANADFNGDGRTDLTVARATASPLSKRSAFNQGSPIRSKIRSAAEEERNPSDSSETPLSPPIYWYTSLSGSGAVSIQQWGDAATDFVLAEDFDGDSKDDLAVWREGAPTVAAFYIFQSATGTVNIQPFGQDGDDPLVVGDYDGDGRADPAVFRCPPLNDPAGQCSFYYRGSSSNPGGNVTYVPWGFGNDSDFFADTGDFDGDGKNDFCIQREHPTLAGKGQFLLLKSGGGIEYIDWGFSSDLVLPGDYDGDGKADLMVRRNVGGNLQHWLLTRTGAVFMTQWGVAGDTSAPGDYDGDGKTDLAIWRGSTVPTQSYFWVLNSSNGSVTSQSWGQCPTGNCDFPVAGWAVH